MLWRQGEDGDRVCGDVVWMCTVFVGNGDMSGWPGWGLVCVPMQTSSVQFCRNLPSPA